MKVTNILKSNKLRERALSFICVVFLAALSFIVLYPFVSRISSVFMSKSDLQDPTVWLIPKNPTLANVLNVIKYGDFWGSLANTFIFSFFSSILQVLSSVLVAYGISHFKFRGKKILIVLVVLTLIIPPQLLFGPMYTKFRFFDWFGIFRGLGLPTLNLQDSFIPMFLLSATSLGLKCGLFILILVQQFNAVPKELSEAAKVDGAGVIRTFWQINLPLVKPVMVSVFLLSFAWLWTDTFYSGVFLRNKSMFLNLLNDVATIYEIGAVGNSLSGIMMNAALVMMIIPLIVIYLLGQRSLIQGIQSSGIVG
jgi:multiple sugar transport system permease protein